LRKAEGDFSRPNKFWGDCSQHRLMWDFIVLVDTHCHLDFESFTGDREAVLQRAAEAGVIRILNPGIDLPTSQAAIGLASKWANVFAAVGVHPNEAAAWDNSTLNELRRLASAEKVVAIGEIGLDYYWDRTPPETQFKVFKAQLDLAAELGLPVVVHIRDKDRDKKPALRDVMHIIEEWKGDLNRKKSPLADRPGVLHSFSGDAVDAEEAIALGFRLGITGPVTFKNADTLKTIVSKISADALLTETDAPFLTPHPYRGKRNEPGYVRYVAEKIADLRGVSLERISEITTANAERLFNW
jgi:TatD DNase family protein